MGAPSRNAECPCGSGLKYKRCCLAAEQRERQAAGFENAVGKRISAWAMAQFPEEVDAALEHVADARAPLDDRDYQALLTWFCSDRELAGGGTPSERYAARLDIDARERDVAVRIAAARLSLQRVRAAQAGRWIELEDVLDESVVRVRSADVSREVVRWDALLCRLMDGEEMPSLWGPVMLFAPAEEPELTAELERLADAHGIHGDSDRFARVLHVAALELMRFVPASRRVEPSIYTVEGDPVVDGRASWDIADPAAVLELLDCPPELAWVGESEDGSGETFQLTVERAKLVGCRGPLPPGAICLESSLTELPGRVCLATLDLTDEGLGCSAISEARLEAAIELVDERLGPRAELIERTVAPLESTLSDKRDHQHRRRERAPGLSAAETRKLEEGLLNDRFRDWLDQPLQPLGGRTPREAARDSPSAELELLLRGIENRAERSRREGIPWPDVGWLRDELGLSSDQRAA